MFNLVLFGPPGCGKGTQCEKLIDRYGLAHLSTGDVIRDHINRNTEQGQLVKKYSEAGNLVPDDVVIGMVAQAVEANSDAKGIIFDGFPRTTSQAEALDIMLSEKGLGITAMIALEVPDAELVIRIKERGKTSGRIDDQDESKIANRIQVYKSETLPVLDFYTKQNKSSVLNGVGAIDEIFTSICDVVDSAK